jgi:hypothetical protein
MIILFCERELYGLESIKLKGGLLLEVSEQLGELGWWIGHLSGARACFRSFTFTVNHVMADSHMADPDDFLVTRRSRRSTAGNRYESVASSVSQT